MTSASIVLCIPSLTGGGAERAMTIMAGWWAARGASVTLITFTRDRSAYPLHPDVRRLPLDAFSPDGPHSCPLWPEEAFNIARLRMALEQCLAETQARPLPVTSFLTRMNLRTILAARGLPCRVVVSERIYPPLCPLPAREEALRRKIYPEADSVVFQTKTGRLWGCAFLPAERCALIPNCVKTPEKAAPAPEGLAHLADAPFFLAAGRLIEQKRFDLLLTAFAPLAAQHPGLRLVIAGEGPLKGALEDQAERMGMRESLILPGFVDNLPWLMRRARAFVLSSAFEGFPNVLLESLANGCPVIAADCPTGPGDIVRHDVDGMLVLPGDAKALHTAMSEMLENDALRDRLAANAQDALERFSVERVMKRWNAQIWGDMVQRAPGPASS